MEEIDASLVDEFIRENANKTQNVSATFKKLAEGNQEEALRLLGALLERLVGRGPEDSGSTGPAALSPAQARDMAIAAVEALGRIRDHRAANILLRASEGTGDKALRKKARTMLFQLRSWGVLPDETVAQPEPSPGEPRGEQGLMAKGVKLSERLLSAFASLPDLRGDMGIHVLARPRPGNYEHFMFGVTEEPGFFSAFRLPSSRKKFLGVVENLAKRPAPGSPNRKFIMPEVGLEFPIYIVNRVIADGSRLSAHRGQRGEVDPETLSLWQELTRGEKIDMHPVYEELDAEEIRNDPSLLADSWKLEINYRERHRWWMLDIPEDEVTRLLGELEKALGGVIQVSRIARLERVERIMREIIEKAFGEKDRRLSFAGRMENVAYILKKAGFETDARRALAVALALRDEGVALPRIPFLVKIALYDSGLESVYEVPEWMETAGGIIAPFSEEELDLSAGEEPVDGSGDIGEDENDEPKEAERGRIFVPGPGGTWVRR